MTRLTEGQVRQLAQLPRSFSLEQALAGKGGEEGKDAIVAADTVEPSPKSK